MKSKGIKKKVAIVILLMFLFVTSGVFAYGYYLLDRLSTNDKNTEQISVKEPVNILLLGVDAGDYTIKSDNKPRRSDTMMLVRYNPEDKKIYMLSIPRDTRVNIDGQVEKLNSAHRIGGPELAINTIEKMLGVKINYYARIDYAAFRQCIDAIGGVDVVVPFNMDYDAYEISIHFKKGETVHMDGKKAEEFVRWRKNNDGGGYAMGDLGRVATQQEFLLKIADKLRTPAGMIRIPGLIEIASKNIDTNMSAKTMFKYFLAIRNIDTSKIEKKVLEGEPKYLNNVSWFIWDKSKNAEYVSNFKDESSNKAAASVDKSKISISILNSTGVNGLASKYKKEFSEMGYNVVQIGNYSKKLETTVINDYSKEGYGQVLFDDIAIGNVVEKENENATANVVVILGKDSVK
jgi:LCP family protein required for cell wall assembly